MNDAIARMNDDSILEHITSIDLTLGELYS